MTKKKNKTEKERSSSDRALVPQYYITKLSAYYIERAKEYRPHTNVKTKKFS